MPSLLSIRTAEFSLQTVITVPLAATIQEEQTLN